MADAHPRGDDAEPSKAPGPTAAAGSARCCAGTRCRRSRRRPSGVPEPRAITEWSMTSSTGTSGIDLAGVPAEVAASRRAWRPGRRRPGTPVRSCIRTRSGVRAISVASVPAASPWRSGGRPAGDRLDVRGGDLDAVLVAEQVLQDDLDGVGEARDAEGSQRVGLQREVVERTVATLRVDLAAKELSGGVVMDPFCRVGEPVDARAASTVPPRCENGKVTTTYDILNERLREGFARVEPGAEPGASPVRARRLPGEWRDGPGQSVGRPPREVAEEVCGFLDLAGIASVAVAGPGFLNIALSPAFLRRAIAWPARGRALGRHAGGSAQDRGHRLLGTQRRQGDARRTPAFDGDRGRAGAHVPFRRRQSHRPKPRRRLGYALWDADRTPGRLGRGRGDPLRSP